MPKQLTPLTPAEKALKEGIESTIGLVLLDDEILEIVRHMAKTGFGVAERRIDNPVSKDGRPVAVEPEERVNPCHEVIGQPVVYQLIVGGPHDEYIETIHFENRRRLIGGNDGNDV